MKVQSLFDDASERIICQVRPSDNLTLRCQTTEMVEGFEERNYGSVGVLKTDAGWYQFIKDAIERKFGIINKSLASDSQKRYLVCGILYSDGTYDEQAFYTLDMYLPKHPEHACWYCQVTR